MQQDKTRELAIEWWNNQNEGYQILQFNQFKKEHFTPSVEHNTLTGREIEIIFSDLKLSERAISEHPQTTEKGEDVQPTEEIEHHARLIANAPAMYNAFKKLLLAGKGANEFLQETGTVGAYLTESIKEAKAIINQIDNK